MTEFTVGNRVRTTDLPRHTFAERVALAGQEGRVHSVSNRYIEVELDSMANDLYTSNFHLFLPDELELL